MTDVKRYANNNRVQDRETLIQEIFDFVVAYKDRYNGNSPSLVEISKGCYTSRTNVVRYLDILEARGYIQRNPYIPRSIRILPDKDRL